MPLPNEIILASAGSGKTFSLVLRFLKLLRCGVAPERIIALTFTRKAAGEFTDRIIRRLQEAASDDKKALDLHGHLESVAGPSAPAPKGGFSAAALRSEFSGMLRTVTHALPKTFLGTLDSFFTRLLRCHPLEFGLDADFTISGADEFGRRTNFDVACAALFRSRGDAAARDQFIDTFEAATVGRDEKGVLALFESFVGELHGLWLAAPEDSRWGNPAAIAPKPWFAKYASTDVSAAGQQFLTEIQGHKLPDRQLKKFQEFVSEMENRTPGTPAGQALKYMMNSERLGGRIQQLLAGDLAMKVYSNLKIGKAACQALEALLGRIIFADFSVACARTQGLCRTIRAFEEKWDLLVRSQGRLDFSDITHLLAGGASAGHTPVLSSRPPGADDRRLWIDYRTDSAYDHWLLDEFQDTSAAQWKVIRNLIDEAIQDPDSRGRSFFQVGDVKQAIYRWRGGEWRLSRKVAEHYSIAPKDLAESHRSAQPVIDTVNHIFGDGPLLAAIFGEDAPLAVGWWKWPPHRTAKTQLSGFSAVVRPLEPEPGEDGEDAEDDAFSNRIAAVEALLREIRPVERGLSCGILFRDNGSVHHAAQWLRSRPNLPQIVSEADVSPAVDNPLTLALLSLLKLAAHPGDTTALRHLEMTPLRAWVAPNSGCPAETRREIARDGFAAWAAARIAECRGHLPAMDAYTASRAAHFLTLAREFDTRGLRDIDAFLQFCQDATVKEAHAPNAVQIMTVHKSKGLEFDVVFLPVGSGGKSFAELRSGLLAPSDDTGDVAWVLDGVKSELAAAVPELGAARILRASEQCYEEFCLFYVAVTRAARGLYFVVDPPPKKPSTGKTAHRWINESLCIGQECEMLAAGRKLQAAYSVGDEHWHASVAPKAPVVIAPPAVYQPPAGLGRVRHPRRTPSGSEKRSVSGKLLFSPDSAGARDRGTLLHALLQQVEWIDSAETALSAWFAAALPSPERWQAAVLAEAKKILTDPGVRQLFTRPADAAGLWRERTFECILDGEWVTGAFDRVVLLPGRAHVIDFKTDAVAAADVPDKAASYQPQMNLYRRVLARLLGIAESDISATLLFTAPGVLHPA